RRSRTPSFSLRVKPASRTPTPCAVTSANASSSRRLGSGADLPLVSSFMTSPFPCGPSGVVPLGSEDFDPVAVGVGDEEEARQRFVAAPQGLDVAWREALVGHATVGSLQVVDREGDMPVSGSVRIGL